jgi:glycosyltransferase involved in cell wall biosynthesis
MTDALRVAIVTHYPADPTRVVGGVQAVSLRLVDELRNAPDLELHVVHCHSDINTNRTIRQGGVTLHFKAQSRRRVVPNMITGITQIGHLLREIRPDVVHAHGPSLAVAALQAGWNPIWTIHGVLRQEKPFFPGLFNRLSFTLAQNYERQALRRVHLITAVSPYVIVAYRGRTAARWKVIENPADRVYFDLPRRLVPGRLLMPASLIPRKDPLTLVRAAAEVHRTVPHLQAHVAGSLADTGYVQKVREEIARLRMGEVVTLLGPLDSRQLQQEYSEAEVVVLPSRQESAPLAVAEAMAAGIPVVGSAVGGIPDMVEDGVTGYQVPPGDADALASALIAVLKQPELGRAMGLAAQAVARVRFDPSRIAASYLGLYRSGKSHSESQAGRGMRIGGHG